jgi:electron transfer flavoprotein beta subunit
VVTGRRDGDTASEQLRASLPALVSVTDQSGEARYPSFKGIMAAKKKPVESLDLADLGIDAGQVGLAGSWSAVESAAQRPARTAGTIVKDEGEGGKQLAEYLASQKFI